MVLDDEGRWVDQPIPSSAHDVPSDKDDPAAEDLLLPPPAIPIELTELMQRIPEEPDSRLPLVVGPPEEDVGKGPLESGP
jgi:hypothetical protein